MVTTSILLNSYFDLASIIGYAGVVANIVWPIFRGRTTMLLAQVVGAALFAIHFGMIGAWTASLLMIAAGLQALAAVPLGTRPGFRAMYLATIPVIGLILAFSWHGPASIFACLGMATISLGRYQLDHLRFRALLVAAIPFWAVHNIIVWSVPGLFSDVFSFASGFWMFLVALREQRAVEAAEANPQTPAS